MRKGFYSFVCDVHLAKVAKYLRLLGFDTVYKNDLTDNQLLGYCRFGRIGITCDRRLQERMPNSVIVLRCEDAVKQLRRLSSILDLVRFAHPFTRSLCCNRILVPCEKEQIFVKIPKETYRWLDGYWICPKCDRVYWQGTHAKRMRKKVYEILGY